MAKKDEAKGGEKKVDEVVEEIKSKFGEGMIMKLGDVKKVDVAAIPTGSVSLDIALGIGGVPRGRVIEIYGPESSGRLMPKKPEARLLLWTRSMPWIRNTPKE